jgi:REP element-mobilizing transposase RayT
MARQARIEFEGAFYHVMARGDRREPIVMGDEDRRDFLATMGRACARAGWRVHAWVLMTNHYHWLIETPRANLVDGMRWFQNTHTRRFNVRNRQWGHVFGGRYKAVLVDPEDGTGAYFEALLDYIHLNPVRAGMVDPSRGLGLIEYPWSSLSRGYAVAPRKRTEWMEVAIGLGQCPDTAAGRRRYANRLDERARREGSEAGISDMGTQTLQSTLRRGWYWGSEALKERLLALRTGGSEKENRDYRLSWQGRDKAEAAAGRIVRRALEDAGLVARDLEKLPGSDRRKVAIAEELHERTTVSHEWIARQLCMRSAGNVSQQLYRKRKNMEDKRRSDEK